jgi:hypothetical protein
MSSITGNRKLLMPYLLVAGFAIASLAIVSPFASAQTTTNGTSTTMGNATAAMGNATAAIGNATSAAISNATSALTGNVTNITGRNATIILTPASIKAGEKLTVAGSGFSSKQNVTLMIDNNTLDTSAPITTDDKGAFSATATPAADITSGSHKVSATDFNGVKASTTLNVNATSTAPTGNATSSAPAGKKR